MCFSFNWYSWGSTYALFRLALPLALCIYYIYVASINWEGLNHFLSDTTSSSCNINIYFIINDRLHIVLFMYLILVFN